MRCRTGTWLLLTLLLCLRTFALPGNWKVDGSGELLSQPAEESCSVRLTLPGSAQIYREPERESFRPDRAGFEAAQLEMEVRLDADAPVKALLFFKDKDGTWFQTVREFELVPGRWQTLSARLDRTGEEWRGVGHGALFDADAATNLFAAGISLYSEEMQQATLTLRNVRRTGKRQTPPLAVIDWQLPENGEKNRRIDSRFLLSRDYFNPFDPDEIEVNYELTGPDGSTQTCPAFFNRDYLRSSHFTRETLTPVGGGFWELRFLPAAEGTYRLRLSIEDKTAGESLKTAWRTVKVAPSPLPGRIRVSPTAPRFFEHDTGEFFFPIGLNIHTNTDMRSELWFRFGHLPDRGTRDYDDYFEACGKNGINTVEVWMAGWTMALEHNAPRAGQHGVGRYSMESAWKLDHLFESARRNGLYLNLVIDNHGRLSSTSDPEWGENPINATSEFARANGGFLKDPGDFFRSPEAKRNNSKRARYIAARWGAMANLFAIELWSEVDLVSEFHARYTDGSILTWTRDAAAELQRWSQRKPLVSTHICSDFNKLLQFRKLFDPKEITHVAGDAYRDAQIHFVDHLRSYARAMKFNKPQLITEYGGPSQGSENRQLVADIHAGLWGASFSGLAGTPFLWWHDFVHLNQLYGHYRGFARFFRGIDLRSAPLTDPVPELVGNRQECEILAATQKENAWGWIFHRASLLTYPEHPEKEPLREKLSFRLKNAALPPGAYRLRWYDTLSGEVVKEKRVTLRAGEAPAFPVPAFRVDTAFKLEKVREEAR